MKESYKGHVIEIKSEERDGLWWASSSIEPRVGAISDLTDAGPSIGFDTREEAELSALTWAKQVIDRQ